ncbi:MAG: MopE-related protein [Polyangiaceae bacterium]
MPGECAAGTTACTGGAIACNQNVQPSAEACDGLDNDCDGTVDNGNPGGGMACSTGLPGVCATGTSACTGGAIVCNQTTMASAEICDGLDNDCNGTVDNGNPGGGGSCTVAGLLPPCAAGTNQCQNGAVTCVSNTPPAPETCDNVDNDCDGIVDDGPIALQIYFSEDFSDNGAGWTTAGGWAIGATSASTGQSYGNPDPANDHTTTNDNGVAGVVLGGNVATTIVGQTYLTSPVVDTSGATGKVYLSFWRWLNSDYSPYMVNQVQVYNGATWNTIYQSGGSPGVQDNAWAKQQYDITAYKSATMQVRFGYSRQSGAFTVSGWNIDDLVISNSPHPAIYLADEFSDNSNNWTLGTSWAIGATSASSGQSYGGPDPALDHTPGGNNGVMGVVLGGNAPTNHPYYYTTSKALNTAGAEVLNLSFWRWLNSDYASFMVNQIQVYNGATWNTIYQTGGSPGVQDSAWTAQSFNILAHKAANMQVRIGYTATSGAYTVSSWNVDDLLVTGGTVCQ